MLMIQIGLIDILVDMVEIPNYILYIYIYVYIYIYTKYLMHEVVLNPPNWCIILSIKEYGYEVTQNDI